MDHKMGALIRDVGIVGLSLVIAVLLVQNGAFHSILSSTQGWLWLGSFVAGVFFVSIFTAAPATVVLAGLARTHSLFEVVFFGALGGLFGDFIIFKFVEDRLSKDIAYVRTKLKLNHVHARKRSKFIRWILIGAGAVIVASPLPDELGLFLMGLSHIKLRTFIPLSFVLNGLGILIIGLIARSV